MRQSEYTTFYERRGNVKYPVRGKLYMRHRGRAIYVRGGVLTDGLTGMAIPRIIGTGRNNLNKSIVAKQLDFFWEKIANDSKSLPKIQWRSKAGGIVTINGKVIATKEDTKHETV